MADHPSFYDQIKKGVEEFFKVTADGVSIRDIFILNGHIQASVMHALDAYDNPREHLEEAIKDSERVFDEFIVPLDIPWVGASVEKYLEAQIRASIRPGLVHLVEVLGK